jgi:hypothetical protein
MVKRCGKRWGKQESMKKFQKTVAMKKTILYNGRT